MVSPDTMQSEKEKTLEVKRRLALRRDEPELRMFEQKLRDALVFKEQICQMKENRHREIQREVEKRRESEILTKILMEKDDVKNMLIEENRTHKKTYASILQLQMDLQKQLEKQKDEENYLEKIKLDELEEELLHVKITERENKKNKSELHKNGMKLYEKMKEIQEHKSKLTEVKEEARNKYYIKLKEEREIQQNLEFKLKMKRKEETFERLAHNALSLEKASKEREKLIKELQDHEYKIKLIQNDKGVDKKNMFRKELVKTLKVQIELQAEHEKVLKEEELKFKNQLIEQAKEEELLENENKIIFDLINKKYSLDIQMQMEASKIKSEKQKELAKGTLEYINQYNNEKMMEIEKEKIAMIHEYNPS